MMNTKSKTTSKPKAMAFLGIRAFATFMTVVMMSSTFYYNKGVASNFRDAMGATSSLYGGHVSQSPIQMLTATVPEIELYPVAFQRLQRQHTEDKKEKQTPHYSDPSSWTGPQRSAMHREYLKHNRESIYSLLLLPKENTTAKTDANADTDTDTDATTTTTPLFDTNLQWGKEFEFIYDHFRKRHKQGLIETYDPSGMDFADAEDNGQEKYRQLPAMLQAAWGNTNTNTNNTTQQKPRVIFEHNICHAFKHAQQVANFSTSHILVTHLNENWGTLSSEVEGRTAMWGDTIRNTFSDYIFDDFVCDAMAVKELYLDSPHTLAIFTTQHQAIFDHPKVHSIPIGYANSVHGGNQLRLQLLQQQQLLLPVVLARSSGGNSSDYHPPRPQLLMINNAPTNQRRPQNEAVIANFRSQGRVLRNTYNVDGGHARRTTAQYYDEMSRSKFILCPAGMGWDSYRIWEALAMGAIPVIEKYVYRYEQVIFPPGSSQRSRILRTLKKGETVTSLQLDEGTEGEGDEGKFEFARYVKKHNASLEVVEYEDGWRRALEDLPVVWIDGEFGDTPHTNSKSTLRSSSTHTNTHHNRNYLTPEFLEREYDALAARSRVDTFRYEKLTSLYWIRFIESFVLLQHPEAAQQGLQQPWQQLPQHSSVEEQRNWETAMHTLSSVYNDHDYYNDGIPWKTPDEMMGRKSPE